MAVAVLFSFLFFSKNQEIQTLARVNIDSVGSTISTVAAQLERPTECKLRHQSVIRASKSIASFIYFISLLSSRRCPGTCSSSDAILACTKRQREESDVGREHGEQDQDISSPEAGCDKRRAPTGRLAVGSAGKHCRSEPKT